MSLERHKEVHLFQPTQILQPNGGTIEDLPAELCVSVLSKYTHSSRVIPRVQCESLNQEACAQKRYYSSLT